MPSDRPDGDGTEHFLVDGVAPPVIGGGPPESPFDIQPDPEPEPREPRRGHVEQRREPPTSPIPVVHTLPQEPERPKRKWFAWMFRGPGAGY